MLSTRLLTQFVAVAEELHFGRAAVRVHMEQSPLSQAIRRLERNLGVSLFSRTKRSVTLTPAGEVFFVRAKAMLRAEHETIAMARRAHEFGSGRLAIGFVGTVAYGIVPKLLRNFRVSHPEIHLNISEMTTRDQIQNLMANQLDVGFVRLPLQGAQRLKTRTIETDCFALALPMHHSRASEHSIALADLKDEAFVAYSHDRVPLLHSSGVAICLEEGFYPNIVCEAWQASSILSFVASGVGMALIPAHLSVLRHAGVVYRPLSKASANQVLEIAVVWRNGDRSPSLSSFLHALSDGLAIDKT